ncbi:MAG: hypothetical protein KDK70_27600, partial [Myxococcales bacterium]|nr:hypothetical protein [Myxococcales bacterium]
KTRASSRQRRAMWGSPRRPRIARGSPGVPCASAAHEPSWVTMKLARGLACLSLLTSGCFHPEQPEDTETEGSSSSVGDPTAAPTTTPPTTTTVDDTTIDPTVDPTVDPTDDPPTVTLLVDGSGSPGDVVHSGPVPLTAQASDDGTVVRVDFFDGDALIASDTTEPFEAELLLTSLDDGAHVLHAVAVDDANQEGDSGPVGLAVTIDGGATVASETNLFQMGGISFHPGIGVVHDADHNVIVVGSLTTSGFDVTGVGAISLTPNLGATNWQISVPMSLIDGQPQYLTMGQPVLSADGAVVMIGGNSMGTDGTIDPNASVFRVATDGSGPLPFLELPSDPDVQNIPLAGIATDPQGNVMLAGPDHDITKLMAMGGSPLWQSPAGQAWTVSDYGGHRIRVDGEGDVIFDVFTCAPMGMGCTLQTRKINGFDGNQLWAEDISVGSNELFMHVGGSAPGPGGHVLTLHGPPMADGGGLHMVLRDDGGAILEELTVAGGDAYSVADLAYDEQGHVVVVGTMLPGGDVTARVPFAARFDETGTVLWQRTFSFGAMDDQAMALGLDGRGRVVVVGIADIENIFIVFLGDVWVAQLDL